MIENKGGPIFHPYSLHFGEINFWWAQVENAWIPPKIVHHFSPYQTISNSIFSHFFSIVLISPPTKHTLRLIYNHHAYHQGTQHCIAASILI